MNLSHAPVVWCGGGGVVLVKCVVVMVVWCSVVVGVDKNKDLKARRVVCYPKSDLVQKILPP